MSRLNAFVKKHWKWLVLMVLLILNIIALIDFALRDLKVPLIVVFFNAMSALILIYQLQGYKFKE